MSACNHVYMYAHACLCCLHLQERPHVAKNNCMQLHLTLMLYVTLNRNIWQLRLWSHTFIMSSDYYISSTCLRLCNYGPRNPFISWSVFMCTIARSYYADSNWFSYRGQYGLSQGHRGKILPAYQQAMFSALHHMAMISAGTGKDASHSITMQMEMLSAWCPAITSLLCAFMGFRTHTGKDSVMTFSYWCPGWKSGCLTLPLVWTHRHPSWRSCVQCKLILGWWKKI